MPGKTVGARLYLHTSALDDVSPETRDALQRATAIAGIGNDEFNVVRIDSDSRAVGLLDYAAFFDDPFPSLAQSWKVALDSNATSYRTYLDSRNPPILHRKELLLRFSDQRRQQYAHLTSQLESAGLFDDPVRIGFKILWERLLAERGFRIVGHEMVPVGNDESAVDWPPSFDETPSIERHRTALTRNSFSAPIQLLDRHGFLDGRLTVFDYGCGKGDDLRGLRDNGIPAEGWDPYYAPTSPVVAADVINLGFVLNVIEDPVERREALQRAFALTRQVLAVSVMIATENSVRGTPFADGVMTGRNTFQKYFTQGELREYLEATLRRTAIPVAPGIAFVFRDEDAEQRFQAGRLRSSLRLRPTIREPRPPRQRRASAEPCVRRDKYEEHRELLDSLWQCCLELGREPEPDEVPQRQLLEDTVGSVARGLRLVRSRMGLDDFGAARVRRTGDLKVFFALQLFRSRQPYSRLEQRLQRDVKEFFGSYSAALKEGRELLEQAAQEAVLQEAARRASEQGLGWLDPSGYLQLHSALVTRLPTVLRAYVGCASALYGDLESADLIKIHLGSGKVSLMTFDDFTESAVPRMTRRVKVNLRTQNVSAFYYGGEYEPPFLYLKSRYLNEESPKFAEQFAFDQALQGLKLFDFAGFGPAPDEFLRTLHGAHWTINRHSLERLHYMPDLDAKCGRFLTYRQLVECGETQHRLYLPNLPKENSSYTALYDIAANVLDPVIDYFGMIELTYGFCSPELARNIHGRIAPKLDQHAAHERKRSGAHVCERLGAAVDFLVRDEDMAEVAEWIQSTLLFDRMYFYGANRPLHISFGLDNRGEVVDMIPGASGARIPRVRRHGVVRNY